MSKDDENTLAHTYVFPAVTFYVAALEAYFQELMALSLKMAVNLPPEKENRLLELKNGRMKFSVWLKKVFTFYHTDGFGKNSTEYQNALAVKRLRDSVIHYNPEFINYIEWPQALQNAVSGSKLEIMNSGWTTNFSQPAVADWAHDAIKAIVILFCNKTGAENPFEMTPEWIRWE
ncbi:hypothetical protein BOV94_12530 [Solemya velum gill symbiont]|uniref:hypothetical protein n=1 Tax=Solemya velum gill symbiont TaxID=2340 RepID=UPI00099720F2|nr:hypothetical protein [Solemya velum gill symbiont]OOY49070.1 hypothetical protein BOV94_12530 [Solemya velum gill symbiont]